VVPVGRKLAPKKPWEKPTGPETSSDFTVIDEDFPEVDGDRSTGLTGD